MTIISKIAISGVTLSTIGGVGYIANHYLSKETIEKNLKDKGHTLLGFNINNNGDKTTWDPIVKAYANSQKKFKDVTITLPSDSSNTPSQANVNKLKEACKNATSSINYNDGTLLIAEQFCVTPKAIKELIGKNRIKLDSTSGQDENSRTWDAKVQRYLSAKEEQKISGIEITNATPNDEKGKRDKLKEGCRTLEEKKTYEPDFHTNFSKFKEWCTNPKE